MLSEVPEGWEKKTLGEICSPKQHPTIQKTKFTADGYPVFGANGQIGLYSEYTHSDKTIAITCRGATCGTINVAPPKSYITGNAMALDTLNESAVTFDFLRQYLLNFGVEQCISGSAQPQITRASLLPIELILPPLNEQQRIAEILSSVDASIQATQAVIEQAERVKRGLMEELLTGGLGSETIERGELPEGWELQTLQEICVMERGKFSVRPRNDPKYYGGRYPFIQTGEVANASKFIRSFSQTLNEDGFRVSKLFPLGSLMMSIAANVGNVAIVEFETAAPDSIVSIKPHAENSEGFFYYLLSHAKGRLEAIATQNAQANLNLEKLNKFKVMVPPQSEWSAIEATLSSLDIFIAKQKAIIDQQTRTKKGLMDDLLTGKVRTV